MADILVIDDHPGDRLLVSEALAGAGHEIREANDGAEALAMCHQRCPDLVVTDIVMEPKDGIEIIRTLRKTAPDLPILAVSGTEYASVYLSLVAVLGANAALPKPFDFDRLVRVVNDLLGRARKCRMVAPA